MSCFACASSPSAALDKVGHENSARQDPKGMIMGWPCGGTLRSVTSNAGEVYDFS
jgi:hypothetical protein